MTGVEVGLNTVIRNPVEPGVKLDKGIVVIPDEAEVPGENNDPSRF